MKQNNKANESGRSMVEMLGTLAIIGVLSIGGAMDIWVRSDSESVGLDDVYDRDVKVPVICE